MRRVRVIPALLLSHEGLYKTLKFRDPKYVGDPINTVRILNDKGADELLLLDITASAENRPPNFAKVAEVASEAFVPMGYGGGIRTLDDASKLLKSGIEKIVLNTASVEKPELVQEVSQRFGSQSVVVSIDARKSLFGGYSVYTAGGKRRTGLDPIACAKRAEQQGAGEILINSIDRDGTFSGYDLELVRGVASAVGIPVVACGGAATIDDFAQVVTQAGASGVAAGSMFVFQKSRQGVLISFPSESELTSRLYDRIAIAT